LECGGGNTPGHVGSYKAAVTGCALSPNEKRILSWGLDCAIKVWDADSGALLVNLKAHEAGIGGAAFLLDGSRIVSTSADESLILWDAFSGAIVTGIDAGAPLFHCVLSPDGLHVLSAQGRRLILCDAIPDSNGKLDASIIGEHNSNIFRSLAFSADGCRIVAVASGETKVKMWDVRSKVLIQELGEHEGEVRVCLFSPDGNYVVCGSDDRILRLWKSGDGCLVGEYDCDSAITVAKWNPAGGSLIVGTASGDILMLRPMNLQLGDEFQ
jgi:WD40 repeat protein